METIEGQSRARARARVQSWYTWAALACALLAVTGFARSYYLKSIFAKPPLPTLLHVHGVIMSAWCLLFFVHTYLVATHRVRVHRRLGIFGAVLAFLVVAIGAYATVAATAREVREHVVRQFHFLFGLNLVNLLLFAIFVTSGLAVRSRPEFHKRLMLMATLSILAPAVARIVLLFTRDHTAQLWAFDFCILIFVAVDTVWHRRLHPALGWGAALVIGSFHLTALALGADWWLPFVARVFA
jgi:cytochrome bd-type quinol oxidase subunit 2